MRADGRQPRQLRPVSLTRGYTRNAQGSVLIEMGNTRVLCVASVEPGVPPWLEGKGKGWLTAEYAMLPGSTRPRKRRERSGKTDGRGVEIQRLIGRSLRNVVNLDRLGENTIHIDCDVLDADGGTRCASITGALVAVIDAVTTHPPLLDDAGTQANVPDLFNDSLTAISVGIIDGEPVVDLNYREDSTAHVDMNLVITGTGNFIEVQGTGEGASFSHDQLLAMLDLGQWAHQQLTTHQQQALGNAWPF